MLTVVHCYTYIVCCLFSIAKHVTRVVIVNDAVIDSPPHGILHGTNQIAIYLLVIHLFVHFFLYLIRDSKYIFLLMFNYFYI